MKHPTKLPQGLAGWLTLAALAALTLTAAPLGAQAARVERFALFVGANAGGPGRSPLRYALADAHQIREVLQRYGGLEAQNSVLLSDPGTEQVLAALAELGQRLNAAGQASVRREFVFYYSGHSDENGLLLGPDTLTYVRLREALAQMPTEVRLAILDSCSSGSFTRLKGGRSLAPFLVDQGTQIKGHAYLTSSSDTEASQESDRLGGSYFTQALVAGLKGAADLTGDNRVTLNEVYQHAFHETLARTETTLAGPQHPSYDIQLSGTGDLVLTDLSTPAGRVVLGRELAGVLTLRRADGGLVAELHKRAGDQMPLAVDTGEFEALLNTGQELRRTRFSIARGDIKVLAPEQFVVQTREVTRLRGTAEAAAPLPNQPASPADRARRLVIGEGTGFRIEWEMPEITLPDLPNLPGRRRPREAQEVPSAPAAQTAAESGETVLARELLPEVPSAPAPLRRAPFNLAFTPGLELVRTRDKHSHFEAAVLIADSREVTGFQGAGLLAFSGIHRGLKAAGLGTVTRQDLIGASFAGIFNRSEGTSLGLMAAGLVNISGDHVGVQSAGLYNGAGAVTGVQTGLVNKAGVVRGVQIGLVNISERIEGVSIGLVTLSSNAVYRLQHYYENGGLSWTVAQLGTEYLYFSAGNGGPASGLVPSWSHRSLGLGARWAVHDWVFSSVEASYQVPGIWGRPSDDASGVSDWNAAEWAAGVPTLMSMGGVRFGPFSWIGGGGFRYVSGRALDPTLSQGWRVELGSTGTALIPFAFWGLSVQL